MPLIVTRDNFYVPPKKKKAVSHIYKSQTQKKKKNIKIMTR